MMMKEPFGNTNPTSGQFVKRVSVSLAQCTICVLATYGFFTFAGVHGVVEHVLQTEGTVYLDVLYCLLFISFSPLFLFKNRNWNRKLFRLIYGFVAGYLCGVVGLCLTSRTHGRPELMIRTAWISLGVAAILFSWAIGTTVAACQICIERSGNPNSKPNP